MKGKHVTGENVQNRGKQCNKKAGRIFLMEKCFKEDNTK